MIAEAAKQLVRAIEWGEGPLLYPVVGSFAGRSLTWRHHGLGMLQAEVSETLRIHVMAVSGIVRDEGVEHMVLCNWVLREASDAIANLEG